MVTGSFTWLPNVMYSTSLLEWAAAINWIRPEDNESDCALLFLMLQAQTFQMQVSSKCPTAPISYSASRTNNIVHTSSRRCLPVATAGRWAGGVVSDRNPQYAYIRSYRITQDCNAWFLVSQIWPCWVLGVSVLAGTGQNNAGISQHLWLAPQLDDGPRNP